MERMYTYVVDKEIGLKDFLLENEYPKTYITYLKSHLDYLKVNSAEVTLNTQLKKDDFLTVLVKEETNQDIVPNAIQLDIIYEDEDIVVVNKPAGMPVHPSRAHFNNSLANALMYRYKKDYVYHVITRLDKDTSGLVLVAKNCYIASLLNKQVREKTMRKKYTVFVCGKTEKFGVIDKPIARVTEGLILREVNEKYGQKAITHYSLKFYNPQYNISQVEAWLETGRTHQIRVHFQAIAHPVIGDRLYNKPNTQSDRLGLHFSSLSFTHPFLKKEMGFYCPLPNELTKFTY